MKNAVTITMIFKASALNRDEKAGGNILTIKKLKRGDGKVYPYISRPAMRHYLWYTLWKKNRDRWAPAEVRLAQNDVIQFDLRKGNAITKAELDLFGYMVTISGQNSITRKAPLGITKAEGLEPWEGDMAFYSNHDQVRRGREQGYNAEPDLYNKEEFLGFFKVSFTLDLERIGVIDEFYKYEIANKEEIEKKEVKEVIIKIPGEQVKITPEGECEEIKDGKEYEGKVGRSTKVKFKRENSEIHFYMKKIEDKIKKGKLVLKVGQKEYSLPIRRKSEDDGVVLDLPDTAVKTGKDNGKDVWFLTTTIEVKIPLEWIDQDASSLESKKIKLVLNKEKRICRIQDVLEALRGGLIYHSSTENYGITPLFFAAAIVKVPIPVLHNYVVVKNIGRDTFEIDKDVFRKAAKNPWVEKIYVESVFDENITGGIGGERKDGKEGKEENDENIIGDGYEGYRETFITKLLGKLCSDKTDKEEKKEPSEEVKPKEEKDGEMPRGEEFVEQKEPMDEEKKEASVKVETEEEEEAPEGEEVVEKEPIKTVAIKTVAEVQLLKGGRVRLRYKNKKLKFEEIFTLPLEEAKNLNQTEIKEKIKAKLEKSPQDETLEKIEEEIKNL